MARIIFILNRTTDLSDESLGAVDEEVPLPVAEEHVLAEVPLQAWDESLLRHLK